MTGPRPKESLENLGVRLWYPHMIAMLAIALARLQGDSGLGGMIAKGVCFLYMGALVATTNDWNKSGTQTLARLSFVVPLFLGLWEFDTGPANIVISIGAAMVGSALVGLGIQSQLRSLGELNKESTT
jgi:hypothetical protein